MAKKQWSSTAPPGEFHPYIPAEESIAEFTLRAVVLGSLFGLLFGAVTVYVGLRAGLTVSASIPIAVLSISILRAFGRSTILENNIVQTTGSAGESLAAGVMFTIPALIFLGFGTEFTFWRIFPLALLGGWLGVLFMIPLRRQLIVKEHGNLTFPEGTACADVLVAGERGGSFAGRVFWGLGLGGVYTFFMNTIQAWNSQPEGRPHWFPGSSFRADDYFGISGSGLHHRAESFRNTFCGRSDFLAAGDARDSIFRAACGEHADLSLYDSDSDDDSGRHVAAIHSSHGSGRGSCGRTDYAAADAADNYFGAARGAEGCSRARSDGDGGEEPFGPGRVDSDGAGGVVCDRSDDVGDADI